MQGQARRATREAMRGGGGGGGGGGIKLPEPPATSYATPEIFDRGLSTVIRRAVIIGNGAAGAEHQSIGLARALGLANSYSLYVRTYCAPIFGWFLVSAGLWQRVDRPKSGLNFLLRWLPLSIHRKIDCALRCFQAECRRIAWTLLRRPYQLEQQSVGVMLQSDAAEADPVKLAALARADVEKNGPLLVLASGRDTVPVAETVKKLAPNATFVIQIQHPRRRLNDFDLVITPIHDFYTLTPAALEEVPHFLVPFLTPQEPPDKRVVLTVGALHIADAAMLRVAAETWHARLAPLPKPLLVVNIGGPTKHCRYGQDLALELVSKIKRVSATCGSIRISYSRRTPAQIADFVGRELGALFEVFIWDARDPNAGPNPHLGHLAWADAFIVTADSISMLSEACSTGKPVYVVGAERCVWKFKSFHKSLRHKGVVRNFTGSEDMSESWSYPPLDDNALAASRVRAALAERGWNLVPA